MVLGVRDGLFVGFDSRCVLSWTDEVLLLEVG